jgi:hypothetical protein
MSKFRGVIMGLGQFCAIVLVIVFTIGGGAIGYLASPIVVIPYANLHLAPGIFGIWVGAILGFLISMFFAAMLFGIAEIAKNTSDRWFQ